ncbi:substrate-binding periplasmic protein [Inhella sp.]|uniref:substrate-binding periplasmic protein n=1 Tax=Inhella sp. TaxID=1921806 RepID=UPI0035B01433
MRRLLWPLIASLLLAARPAVAAPELPTELALCDDANEWPPYTQYRRDAAGQPVGELTGFTVELLRLIASRHGLQLRFEMLPWARCQLQVRQGESLGLLNAIRTPERDREFLVSAPLYETRLLYVWSRQQHPNGLGLKRQQDLQHWRVGGLKGYSYSQMEDVNLRGMTRVRSYEALLEMLRLQRVDLVLVNENVLQGRALLGLEAFRDARSFGVAPLPERKPSVFHLMFTRTRPEGALLHALVNEDLKVLQRGGELARLRAQFLSP